MKHYIRSYWTKYKQLYKKGLKGIAAFLAIGAIIFFCIGYNSESWDGCYLQRGYGATNDDAWFCNRREFKLQRRGGHYPLPIWCGRTLRS